MVWITKITQVLSKKLTTEFTSIKGEFTCLWFNLKMKFALKNKRNITKNNSINS